MCMNFHLTKRDVAIFVSGVIIFSPLLLVGGVVYLGGCAGRGVAMKAHQRRVDRFWAKIDQATAETPLQKLWTAAKHGLPADQWRVGFALLSLGDIIGARSVFLRAVVDQEMHVVPARYYLAQADILLQRWQAAIDGLEVAVKEFISGQSTFGEPLRTGAEAANVSVADLRGLLAYAVLMKATRGVEEVDYEAVERAKTLIEKAVEADPSNPRHGLVAAWVLYTVGLRSAGESVFVDAVLLGRALSELDRARSIADATEREAHLAILAEFGERVISSQQGVVDGQVVPKSVDDGEDHNDDNASTTEPVTPLESSVTGVGAGGVSIAEILSLKAQILLALGQTTEAAASLKAARDIDPDVSHSGLSTDAEDPRVGLLAPWPLPKGASGEEVEVVKQHSFSPAKLIKPTWCDHCMNRIKGFSGLRCDNCRYTIHDSVECRGRATLLQCYAAATEHVDAPPTTHQHQLRIRRVHTTHDCLHCGKFIMLMTRALECHVCRAFAHVKCAKLIPNAVIDAPAQTWDKLYEQRE